MSDKQNMEVQHSDGSTVAVQVQGSDRHGDGSRWARQPRGEMAHLVGAQQCGYAVCCCLRAGPTNRDPSPWRPSCPAHARPRWTLRVTVAPVQPAGQQRPNLLQVLDSTGAHRHPTASESEEEGEHADADMQ